MVEMIQVKHYKVFNLKTGFCYNVIKKSMYSLNFKNLKKSKIILICVYFFVQFIFQKAIVKFVLIKKW